MPNYQIQINVLFIIQYQACQRESPANMFLGATMDNPEKAFQWNTGAPLAYKNWFEGEPNNKKGKEFCLQMRLDKDGQWNDFDFNSVKKQWAMCELVFPF